MIGRSKNLKQELAKRRVRLRHWSENRRPDWSANAEAGTLPWPVETLERCIGWRWLYSFAKTCILNSRILAGSGIHHLVGNRREEASFEIQHILFSICSASGGTCSVHGHSVLGADL